MLFLLDSIISSSYSFSKLRSRNSKRTEWKISTSKFLRFEKRVIHVLYAFCKKKEYSREFHIRNNCEKHHLFYFKQELSSTFYSMFQKWLQIQCFILFGNSRARLRLFLRQPAWFYDKNTAPKAYSLSNVLYLNATSLLQPNALKGFLVKPLLVFILCTGPDRSNFTLISNLTTRVLMTLVRV